MSDIRPFQAYRPRVDLVDKIAALPYDVYSREEAYKVVRDNPDSFLAVDRPETGFKPDVDMYSSIVYQYGHDLLHQWIAENRFIKDNKPCYYLYEQTMNGKSQTGIVACASIDDYVNNVIKKHENTRKDKELDRIRHVDTCGMQTGPILLAYRRNQELKSIISSVKKDMPVYSFISGDDIGHRVWVIDNDRTVENIYRIFRTMNAVYIADGHHRCASAVKVGLMKREANEFHNGDEDYNFFLSVLFQDDELNILDYNRVVKDLNGLSEEKFLEEISKCFTVKRIIEGPFKPQEKGQFGMCLGDDWFELKAHDNICSSDPVKGLDVSLLQDYLLGPILGIQDPKTDKRIDFVGGIRGLTELEYRVHTDMKVAFSMYPTSLSELESVADAGLLMPPKSTWFEPKLRSGLFLHEI